MAEFKIVGTVDPFLLVALKKGEVIYAESNAMVTMDATLELKGKMQGGLLRSLARKIANNESFFQQSIEANFGDGEILLAPELPGEIEILDVGEKQYRLTDGAFLASTNGVNINIKTQGIGMALFGGTGGFFLMETSGQGKLAVSGFGSVFGLDVTSANDVIVDNYHVVAWDSNLQYNLSMSTTKAGFFRNLVSSQMSGEGLVIRFSGNGKIYVCSRNKGSFVNWIFSNNPSLQNR
ncbi:MAG: TIGR00266 family protein [Desulfobacterales bacterium]|nr:TIGR00266 family protein [Desulfobacterales bacterium]